MDSGEYVYYTRQWVTTGRIYLSVDGWADAYPFFPGMFALNGSVNMAGMHIFHSVAFASLILSTFIPLSIFLISHKITGDVRSSLYSALFLSMLAPFIYSISQPKPETVGFFIMLIIILMSVMLTKGDKRLVFLMVTASLALIVTHHFSSLFLMIFLYGGLFLSVLARDDIEIADRYRLAFFLFFTTTTILYWLTAAPPFREGRLLGAFGFPSYTILLGPYIGVGILLILKKIVAKNGLRPSIYLHRENLNRFYLLSLPLVMIISSIIIYLYFYPLPGREMTIGELGLYYIPITLLGIFVLGSSKILWAFKDGVHLYGWISITIVTFFVGFITGSTSLLPMRQVAFIMIPTSILFGIGLLRFQCMANPFSTLRRTFVIGVFIIALFAYNVPLMYPSQEMAQGHNEAIGWDEISGGFWIRYSLEDKIAAEHRLSSSIFAVGYTNITWVDGWAIYFSNDIEEALEEAHEMDVRYIIWDQKSMRGVATTDGAHPYPMSRVLIDFYSSNYMVYSGRETVLYVVP